MSKQLDRPMGNDEGITQVVTAAELMALLEDVSDEGGDGVFDPGDDNTQLTK